MRRKDYHKAHTADLPEMDNEFCRKWITNIGVLMLIVSVVLPNTRNWDRIPGRCVVSLLIEEILKIMNALAILELPVTTEHLNAIRTLTMFNQIIHADRGRNIIRSIWHGSNMVRMKIFIMRRYDQLRVLLWGWNPSIAEIPLDLLFTL